MQILARYHDVTWFTMAGLFTGNELRNDVLIVSKLEPSSKFGAALAVLSDRYRRELLLALLAENPQNDDDRDPLDVLDAPTEPEVLETELFHNHLPRLESMGFIKWNRDTGKISKGPDWADIEPILALIADHRDELPEGWL